MGDGQRGAARAETQGPILQNMSKSTAAHLAYLSIYCCLRKQEIPTTMGEAQSSVGQMERIKDARKMRLILMGSSSL